MVAPGSMEFLLCYEAEQKLADLPLVALSEQEFKQLCPGHANTKYASLTLEGGTAD